jgi:hypothetical protein
MTFRKTSISFFLFLALISCGKNGSTGNNSMSEDSLQNVDTDPNSPTPAMAHSFRVNPMTTNFDSVQNAKIQDAASLIEKVVSSDEFRHEVLNHTYNGKREFVDNGGYSNAQIYQKILNAKEKMLKLGNNNVMDLELELYNDQTTTIGYTFPDVVRIFMNTKYFNSFDATQVTDNMFHEWLHKIGFDHAVNYTPSRDHSVPYAIGYIVKRLAKQHL